MPTISCPIGLSSGPAKMSAMPRANPIRVATIPTTAIFILLVLSFPPSFGRDRFNLRWREGGTLTASRPSLVLILAGSLRSVKMPLSSGNGFKPESQHGLEEELVGGGPLEVPTVGALPTQQHGVAVSWCRLLPRHIPISRQIQRHRGTQGHDPRRGGHGYMTEEPKRAMGRERRFTHGR